ncbi:hypothetical protein [uncultured Gammaproteobacteria bacterium]|jgi:hypothetical protein|nr:hypothetical protein BROOK1789B_718 [Bathymodiolus brooksi thiotrophic gill symbiont]CAC9577313.1 hypothetical protein [uncultured Gammaproteobacteria bacterium]CAB9543298.1 hypothetical protein BROOK1789C_839 [Bathymodiolus brooksi thiotrophic gill symbiont]CAC9611104.1 hypothetical protein [uncultured Gammaproteobacteria bacterium]CAC9618525.1 hypothetical protein [uncultured Gammaproteobacteria bacterium]
MKQKFDIKEKSMLELDKLFKDIGTNVQCENSNIRWFDDSKPSKTLITKLKQFEQIFS